MNDQKQILVVDDEVDFRLAVAEILVDHGFKVLTAKNGEDALRLLQGSDKFPDLITIDMNMPKKNGLQFHDELKQLNPDIPLIMISGFLPKQICKISGICAFLLKPLDKIELLHTIKNQITFSS